MSIYSEHLEPMSDGQCSLEQVPEGHDIDAGLAARKCTNGNKVTITFGDGEFTFHAQWLHDARCDDGAQRNANSALGRQPTETVRFESTSIRSSNGKSCLDVRWDDGLASSFPIEWLRVMAPIVASTPVKSAQCAIAYPDKGWTVDTLRIPEISYNDIFSDSSSDPHVNAVHLKVADHLLSPQGSGLIKIVDMPPPNVEDELNHVRNLNTAILTKLFGSVFVHPLRGSDKSFNVSSRPSEASKRANLPNYDTNQLLFPHVDHAFYEHPAQVQGWHILEGTSENTFVSVNAALRTLKDEDPAAYRLVCTTPLSFGRRSDYYGTSVYNTAIDTAITMMPGSKEHVKRARWHPNLAGSLLCSYEEYQAARTAHLKFQEILRRDSHQLKLILGPGDMLIWDNFRILHGRERVFGTPRTGVGQTVPEQIVHDRYRAMCIAALDGAFDLEWVVHLPMPQLREMERLVKG